MEQTIFAIGELVFTTQSSKVKHHYLTMDVLDRAINSANFVNAAKIIEYSSIQPSLVDGVLKEELNRNRLKYAYPAVIGNAIIHRDAFKFGYKPNERGAGPRVCACCMERVETQDIGLCYRTTSVKIEEEMGYEEYKLRPGIALFFSFIKIVLFYFIFRFIICDCFNLITNISSGVDCNDSSKDCYPYLWNILSSRNKATNDKFFLAQSILSLIFVVLSIVFFFFCRKDQYSKVQVLNNNKQSEDDYTIMVQNIPLIDFPSKTELKKMRTNNPENVELYHRQHLLKYFENKVKLWVEKRNSWKSGSNEMDFQELLSKNGGELRSQEIVKSISLCYNLERLETLQKERDELVNNHKKYEKLRQELQGQPEDSSLGIMEMESDNRFSSISKQVQFLNDCEVILNKQYGSDNSVLFNITNFVGKAFITFQYQHYREFILEEADKDNNFLIFNGSRLKVSRVPHPRDICWKNLRQPEFKQRKKLVTTLSILIMITVACFGILLALEYGRFLAISILNGDETTWLRKIGGYGTGILSVITILITNQIIKVVASQWTAQEKHYSKTEESMSVILKVVIFQFICSAVLPLLVTVFFNSELADKTGLIFQMTTLMIFKGVIINILSIIFPKAVVRSCLVFFKYGRKKPEETSDKFQVELNQEFQYPQFDLIGQYTHYIVLIFISSFYAYLIPGTTIILVPICFLQYWIDKINLFRRCSHPDNFNYFLNRNILKLFEASIWLFAVGCCIFDHYIHKGKLNIILFVALGIATVYLWFLIKAPLKLERRIFGSYQSSLSALYDDCASTGKFEDTFWSCNPATFLVKESDVTGRQAIANPGLDKIFVSHNQAR